MTTTNSLSARYFFICLFASLSAIIFLSFPGFELKRQNIIETLGITESAFVLGILILVVALFTFFFIRFQQLATQPLVTLIKLAETNRLNSGYSPKTKIMEVDRFRYLLESRTLLVERLESKIKSLEETSQDLQAKLDLSKQQREEATAEISEKTKLIKEMRFEQIRLEEAAKRLEALLEQERKADISTEIEKRSDEIYNQMEKAVEASAYKALWFPQVFQDLKTPASVIQKTLDSLGQNWESSSFARLKSDIETLKTQSDELIDMLEHLTGDTSPPKSKASEDDTSEGNLAEFPKPESSDEDSSSEDAINN